MKCSRNSLLHFIKARNLFTFVLATTAWKELSICKSIFFEITQKQLQKLYGGTTLQMNKNNPFTSLYNNRLDASEANVLNKVLTLALKTKPK